MRKEKATESSVTTRAEEYDEITDKIPQKPVTAAEGTSYTIVILAALAVLGSALYAVRPARFLPPWCGGSGRS